MHEDYRSFDEMSELELVTYIDRVLGWTCSEMSYDELRNLALEGYAERLGGLDMHRSELMQFGDGGYPYLYVSQADGGDSLCHVCATKELKKGATVAWCHHMEGEDEYCTD